jgi:hypothetical protein
MRKPMNQLWRVVIVLALVLTLPLRAQSGPRAVAVLPSSPKCRQACPFEQRMSVSRPEVRLIASVNPAAPIIGMLAARLVFPARPRLVRSSLACR